MNYGDMIRALALKRHQLGMTDTYVACHSGVSQPTVNRILSGRHRTARLDQVLAIARVLGVELDLRDVADAGEMRRQKVESRVSKIAGRVAGTMALEGQGLSDREQQTLIDREILKFLAGPDRKIWSD